MGCCYTASLSGRLTDTVATAVEAATRGTFGVTTSAYVFAGADLAGDASCARPHRTFGTRTAAV